jgi:hypothetical protein
MLSLFIQGLDICYKAKEYSEAYESNYIPNKTSVLMIFMQYKKKFLPVFEL